MGVICASVFAGLVLASLTERIFFIWLTPLLGVALCIWLMIRSQPLPREKRWTELIKLFLAPLVLWLAIQATKHL